MAAQTPQNDAEARFWKAAEARLPLLEAELLRRIANRIAALAEPHITAHATGDDEDAVTRAARSMIAALERERRNRRPDATIDHIGNRHLPVGVRRVVKHAGIARVRSIAAKLIEEDAAAKADADARTRARPRQPKSTKPARRARKADDARSDAAHTQITVDTDVA